MRRPTPQGYFIIALIFSIWLYVLLFTSLQAKAGPIQINPSWSKSLETTAQRYWQPRGFTPPTPVELYRIEALQNATGQPAAGAGEVGGVRVWIAELMFPYLRNGVISRAMFCMVYLHERGHNARLLHDSGWPIMQETPDYDILPPKCLWWSRSFRRKVVH